MFAAYNFGGTLSHILSSIINWGILTSQVRLVSPKLPGSVLPQALHPALTHPQEKVGRGLNKGLRGSGLGVGFRLRRVDLNHP